MRTDTIEIKVYEPGDVIEININNIQLMSKRERIQDPISRMMIVKTNINNKERVSYSIVTNEGVCMKLYNEDLATCRYICSIDISELTKKIKVV